MGEAAARDLLLTACTLDAAEALRPGLVGRLVAPENLDAAAQATTEALSKLSPASQAATKAILNALGDPPARPDLDARFAALFEGPDLRKGTRVFLQKRPPEF